MDALGLPRALLAPCVMLSATGSSQWYREGISAFLALLLVNATYMVLTLHTGMAIGGRHMQCGIPAGGVHSACQHR